MALRVYFACHDAAPTDGCIRPGDETNLGSRLRRLGDAAHRRYGPGGRHHRGDRHGPQRHLSARRPDNSRTTDRLLCGICHADGRHHRRSHGHYAPHRRPECRGNRGHRLRRPQKE